MAYGIRPALVTEREKKQFRVLIEELVSLIGLENWAKLIDVFMKKVDFPEGFDRNTFIFEYILWNRGEFTDTLAKFCEPLIQKGGQDAAKV